ncbi:MAG: chemotaxis protein CheD [Oscillospiraceae bacterium]|nr:chemotaxis protein CheD [Oscillospiraceae bacterium]
MGNIITVGISDMKIASGDDVMVAYALGSCIGTCIYDNVTGIMGLSHILLPQITLCPNDNNVKKFADTAIKELVNCMKKQGSAICRMSAKIAGGAQMFTTNGLAIGERNIRIVVNELNLLGIKIIAADVGGNFGRTMECHAKDGKVIIKSISRGNYTL